MARIWFWTILGAFAVIVAVPSAAADKPDISGCVKADVEAITACTSSLQMNGLDANLRAQVLRRRGVAYYSIRDFRSADADFSEAIQNSPNDNRAYAWRCRSKAVEGKDLASALQDCEKALLLKPDDSSTLQYLGFVQLRAGRNTEALAAYDKALVGKTESAEALFGRGFARLRTGDYSHGYADMALATQSQHGTYVEQGFIMDGLAVDVSNPEMKAIFDADQADRQKQPADWSAIGPADQKRRERTATLLAQSALHTGDDFLEAAFVFQHGDKSDDYLLAHILAMVAVANGKSDAIWIASATLDRYLQKVGQKQVIGTQYLKPNKSDAWTQEPYDRVLVSDALRNFLHVSSQADQDRQLKRVQQEHQAR